MLSYPCLITTNSRSICFNVTCYFTAFKCFKQLCCYITSIISC
nr:MAG TPA: hypothetical protein [Caudoviricetes sp.]